MNIYLVTYWSKKKNHLDILSTGTGYLKTKFSKFSEEIALSRYASLPEGRRDIGNILSKLKLPLPH